MRKEYSKPGMTVTDYSASDKINLDLQVSNAIATYTDKGKMSAQSFKIYNYHQ